ncbi:hypothetical protein D7X25_37830, partial [bacterium 1XD42-8]
KTRVAGRGWTNWFYCPFVEYPGSSEDTPVPAFQKGDKVKVKPGSKTYTGGKLASFVYQTIYDVLEVSGDRIVIGIKGNVTAAIKADDLVKQ